MSSLANYDFTSGESTAKGYLCGTHRLVAPEVTLSRLARAMPVMGITRIANVTDLDIVGIPVERPVVTETTALGAAYLAGLTAGLYPSLDSLAEKWQREARFEPAMPTAECDRLYAGWREAVSRVLTKK